MDHIARRKILELSIRRTFEKHKDSLPSKSYYKQPKMEYHVLADAVFWEDEGIEKCNQKLENAMRFVLNYRTNLIVTEPIKPKGPHAKSLGEWAFQLAKIYFPTWVGFNEDRCTYDPELSKRINRIQKVSKWKIDKLINIDDTEF